MKQMNNNNDIPLCIVLYETMTTKIEIMMYLFGPDDQHIIDIESVTKRLHYVDFSFVQNILCQKL